MTKNDKVLIFSKTEGFRHDCIPTATRALEVMSKSINVDIDKTEDASDFTLENLEKYGAVIFLNTTGDVLNSEQEAAFETYINGGGGYVGIHAAADTEHDWDFYGRLVGAYFVDHPNDPNIRQATVNVLDKNHKSTQHLPDTWYRNDEWYNYRNIQEDNITLMTLDESSYEGGSNGEFHPIAWYKEFEGGRMFYTGGGHTSASYADSFFNKHIKGGIEYVLQRDE